MAMFVTGSSTSTGSFGSVHTAGNVGIGCTPSYALEILTPINTHGFKLIDAGGDFSTIYLDSDNNNVMYNVGGTGSPNLQLGVGGAAKLTILGSNGNVGIGTSAPAAIFDVTVSNAKTAGSGAYAYLGRTNEASNYGALQCLQVGHAAVASRQWQFQTVEQGVANNGIITLQLSGGNVAVGRATADTKLDVTGDIRASTGIKFGTDTASANALDDYEEGTWQPAFVCGTSGTITAHPSASLGTYTKIGNMVHLSSHIQVSAISSPVGALTISGMPFTVEANATHGEDSGCATGTIEATGLSSAFASVGGILQISASGGGTSMRITEFDGQDMADDVANHFGTGIVLRIAISYKV